MIKFDQVSLLVSYDSNSSSKYSLGQIMSNLFHQFLDHKCLSKALILDWYENNDRCNYPNVPQAKQWAASFINCLNPPNQSKPTCNC